MNKNKFSLIGIYLPKEIVKKIDMERGDVNRSRYILRLIETGQYKKEVLAEVKA
jgi:metal-responsive CopG/Arc/MetJ family transcriptional regulator